MTLIELVIAITVIAIAVISVLGVLSAAATRSAEAMIREQAVSIGSAYLNEVLQKPFSLVAVGGSRANFNGTQDYNNLNDVNGARDQFGNGVNGTTQFTVNVAVGAGVLGGVPANQVRRVDVTVTHATGIAVVLSGYRTLYP